MAGFWDRLRGRDQPLERPAKTMDELYQILESERDRRIRAEAKAERRALALWLVGSLLVVGGIGVAVWGVVSATRDTAKQTVALETGAQLNSLIAQVSEGRRLGCMSDEEWIQFNGWAKSVRDSQPDERQAMLRRTAVLEVVPGCGDYVSECRGDAASNWTEADLTALTAEPDAHEGDYLLLPLQEGVLPVCVVAGLDVFDPDTWSNAGELIYLEDALNRD